MSNLTYVKLTGWVTKDPELRQTNGDQTAVCTVRMGTANRWQDKTTREWREGPASYFDVVCWRGLAENVAASLRKGHMVTIHGTFRNKAWIDKDNNPRTSLEITAHSVGHELTYGWSHFNRKYRPSQQASEEPWGGEASRGLDHGQGSAEARKPGWEQREENPFHAGDGQADLDPAVGPAFQSDLGPAAGPAFQADLGPAAGPAFEPAGERVVGTGDEGGDADTAEAAADEPRLEEVAVPV